MEYIQNLFKKFSDIDTESIIANMVLINNNWKNKETFENIKKLSEDINIKNIVAYPSNIVEYIDEDCARDPEYTRLQILNNIASLKPKQSIHTCSDGQGHPNKILIKNTQKNKNIKSIERELTKYSYYHDESEEKNNFNTMKKDLNNIKLPKKENITENKNQYKSKFI